MRKQKSRLSLAPETYQDAVAFSERIAKTSFVPDYYRGNPAEVLAAVMYGAELGLGPMQALTGLIILQGKVTMYVSTMRSLVDASGLMEKCVVEYDKEAKKATVTVRRVGRDEASYTFDEADAVAAGVVTRKMYSSYPQRMYTARAMGFALRDEFGDVLRGLMTSEEMGDDDGDLDAIETRKSDDDSGLIALQNTDPDLAYQVSEGFGSVGLTSAQQAVKLAEYRGREADLVEWLRDEFAAKNNIKREKKEVDDGVS